MTAILLAAALTLVAGDMPPPNLPPVKVDDRPVWVVGQSYAGGPIVGCTAQADALEIARAFVDGGAEAANPIYMAKDGCISMPRAFTVRRLVADLRGKADELSVVEVEDARGATLYLLQWVRVAAYRVERRS